MGMLDGLIGLMSGGTQQGQSPLVQMALQVIQQNGGLPGIIDKCQQAGFGQHAGSWVGTGQNMPISSEQITNVLGTDKVNSMAAQAGVTPAAAGGSLAALLPMLIDKLTPNGQVPHQSSLLEHGMSMLNSLGKTGTEG